MVETIALLGGTGQTGRHIVDYALDKGFKVQMLARAPSKVAKEHANLTVIEGDASNQFAVENTIKGSTYVISCMAGPNKPSEYPKDFMLDFVKMIWPLLDAEPSVKVFIFQSGGLAAAPGKPLTLFIKIMRLIVGTLLGIGPMIADNEKVCQFMSENKKDSFEFIATRPAALQEKDDDDMVVELSQDNMPMSPITFKSLAVCTVDSMNDSTFFGTYPYVAPKKA